MGCIAIARTRIGAASRLCPTFSASLKFVNLPERAARARFGMRRFTPCVLELREICFNEPRAPLSQATFLNRQALHLRPDPARVVVRPFKPAVEPRDLNPTDKTRANHIVERVLALNTQTIASQLAEVLENFLGRHRNLLETFEARADEMEEALATHPPFTADQRRLIGAYFL